MSFFYCILFSFIKRYNNVHKILDSKYNLSKFIKTHLYIVYFTSGIAKASSISWWNGNAIWRAIATLDDFIFINPYVLAVISSSTVLLEIFYPFLVNTKYAKYTVILMISMHLSIGLVMGLSSFSAIMILWNIIAFNHLFINKNNLATITT